jgi:hypothetical protein
LRRGRLGEVRPSSALTNSLRRRVASKGRLRGVQHIEAGIDDLVHFRAVDSSSPNVPACDVLAEPVVNLGGGMVAAVLRVDPLGGYSRALISSSMRSRTKRPVFRRQLAGVAGGVGDASRGRAG